MSIHNGLLERRGRLHLEDGLRWRHSHGLIFGQNEDSAAR